MSVLQTPAPRTRFYLQPKQRIFCQTKADIIVFGGAAGGGKTRGLLYQPIYHKHHLNPGFTGVIFRETYTEIVEAGGIWDEASDVYPGLGAKGIISAHEWRFPSGAKMVFRHLDEERTKYKYKGAQFCYLGFDELTNFSDSRFWYMVSRNRSICGIKPYVRASTNPDPNWVKTDLIAPWVDKEYTGRRAAPGEILFMRRLEDGKFEWLDRPVPHAKSITFIPSFLEDNPALTSKDPNYEANLLILNPVERARLRYGDWDVRREGLVYPGFDACVVESAPEQTADVGGMDFGFNNPFASPWGYVDHDDVLWITGLRYQRQCTIPIHAEAIPRGVHYWCDPSEPESIAQLRHHGHDVLPCVHRPVRGASGEMKKPLLAGIDMVSERMRTGRLKIVRSACLNLVRELGMYHYDPDKRVEEPVKEDDHACDALRYLVVGLDRNRTVPGTVEAAEREQVARREAELAARDEERQALFDPEHEKWWGR